MYTFNQTENLLKVVSVLMDDYHESNDEKKKTKEQLVYIESLRKACIALGAYRYALNRALT